MAGHARQRGVALVLVVLAVAVAFILSLSFMNAQATNAGIARNVTNQINARQIAESALQLAIGEIERNPSYRSAHPNGAWATNQALLGGTFTITGEDGTDTDGDGIVDGDGDLTDDSSDPITLTATATYNGATHTVRAIINDTRIVSVATIAVADKIEIKSSGSKTGLIDSWNSNLGGYSSTSGSNATVSTNSPKKDKIRVKNSGQIRGDVFVGAAGDPTVGIKVDGGGIITGTRGKLERSLLIPGVAMPDFGNDADSVADDDDSDDAGTGPPVVDYQLSSGTDTISADVKFHKFNLSGNAVLTIVGNITIWADDDVEIKDTAQLIVADNSSLKFYTGDNKKKFKVEDDAKLNVNSEKPGRLTFYRSSKEKIEIKDDAQVYGTFIMPSAELKIKDRARVFGSMRGNKLKIEDDGQFHLDLAPKFVNVDDTFIDFGGSDYGIAVEDFIEMKGNARVIPFGGGVTARVSTNSTLAEKIKLKDSSVITGDIYVGPRGIPASVIKYEGGTLSGSENALLHSVDILEADLPIMPAHTGSQIFSNGINTITTDQHWIKLEIKGTAVVEIDGDINIMVDNDFVLKDTAQIQMKGSSTLNLYLMGNNVKFESSSLLNSLKAKPDRVNIFVTGVDNTVEIVGSSISYAHLHAPYAKVKLKDNANWFGNIRCNDLVMEANGIANVPAGIGNGQGQNGKPNVLDVKWVESP